MTRTVNQHFTRIAILTAQSPARIARACDRVGALGERTGSPALLMLSSALNEHRHALQQSWLGNPVAAVEHFTERHADRTAES